MGPRFFLLFGNLEIKYLYGFNFVIKPPKIIQKGLSICRFGEQKKCFLLFRENLFKRRKEDHY